MATAPRGESAGPLADALLEWFAAEQRDLPWRRRGDPYAVWVSEVMLQQTQVATVIPYFELWMARFPTLEDLADAREDDVLRAWQGLGYYSRARSLLYGAREVLRRHGGRVPERIEDLLALPGVGRYTAGAIASIAYNRPAPIVDGNVTRVLCRLFALRGDPRKAPLSRDLWELAAELIPEDRAREFNQALMELGATVCTPANPRCGACPVKEACEGRKLDIQERLPETAARPKVTSVRMAAAVVRRGGRVLIAQRRDDAARWAGMWQFPNAELLPGEEPGNGAARAVVETVGVEVTPGCRATLLRHSVTRYRITLEAFHCSEPRGEPSARGCKAWTWVCPSQLGDYALSAAHRRIAQQAVLAPEGQLELVLG